MLVRFAVANFDTFAAQTEVSLLATDPADHKGLPLIAGFGGEEMIPGPKWHLLLPFILIVGARESPVGSLNPVVKSMKRHIALSSRPSANGKLRISEFRKRSAPIPDKPTQFEVDVVRRRTRYRYGFTFNDDRYEAEWLYRLDGDSKEILFRRNGNAMEMVEELAKEGEELRGRLGSRTLALSAVQQSNSLLRQIRRQLVLFRIIGSEDDARMQQRIAGRWDKRLLPFLQLVDTEICGYGPSKQKPGDGAAQASAVEFIYKRALSGRRRVPFEESPEQLRRWLYLLTCAFLAIDAGSVLFVDKIDSMVGEELAKRTLDLFSDWRLNWAHAQLVATSDTFDLVQSPIVRRDQIWIEQGRPDGSTAIYPLSAVEPLNPEPRMPGELEGLHGKIAIPAEGQSLFSADLGWSPPVLHKNVIGRTHNGRRLWSFRKRIRMLVSLCKWFANHPEVPEDERKRIVRTQWSRFKARLQ